MSKLGTRALNNHDRALLAQEGVGAYAAKHPDVLDDQGTLLVDFLANLMHWAAQEGVDFEQALRSARHHFNEETLT